MDERTENILRVHWSAVSLEIRMFDENRSDSGTMIGVSAYAENWPHRSFHCGSLNEIHAPPDFSAWAIFLSLENVTSENIYKLPASREHSCTPFQIDINVQRDSEQSSMFIPGACKWFCWIGEKLQGIFKEHTIHLTSVLERKSHGLPGTPLRISATRFIFATWAHSPLQNTEVRHVDAFRNRLAYLPVCRRALVALLERSASPTPSQGISILCGAKEWCWRSYPNLHLLPSENDHSSLHSKLFSPSTTHMASAL